MNVSLISVTIIIGFH